MTDKELLEKFERCQEQLQAFQKAVKGLTEGINILKKQMEINHREMKRIINECENGGNIHKDCEWYDEEHDDCKNYMMGVYTGLAFEVSRHDKCIRDIVKENDDD